jgi:Zn-dependent peptidase ImmA (M78 family)
MGTPTRLLQRFYKKSLSLPIDIDGIVEMCGAEVSYVKFDSAALDLPPRTHVSGIVSISEEGKLLIEVNQNILRDSFKQRYIIAHLLGHYCLEHVAVGGRFIVEGDYGKAHYSSLERMAIRFARDLLMPMRLIMTLHASSALIGDDGLQDAEDMAELFEVPPSAISHRIYQCSRIIDMYWRQLYSGSAVQHVSTYQFRRAMAVEILGSRLLSDMEDASDERLYLSPNERVARGFRWHALLYKGVKKDHHEAMKKARKEGRLRGHEHT